MVPRRSFIQGVLKVKLKVKGHMVWALLSSRENRFFLRANSSTATKLARIGPRTGLHPGCAQGQGRGQRSLDTGTFVMSRKSLLLAHKLHDRHQTCTRWSRMGLHPGCAQGQAQCQRSCDMDSFVVHRRPNASVADFDFGRPQARRIKLPLDSDHAECGGVYLSTPSIVFSQNARVRG